MARHQVAKFQSDRVLFLLTLFGEDGRVASSDRVVVLLLRFLFLFDRGFDQLVTNEGAQSSHCGLLRDGELKSALYGRLIVVIDILQLDVQFGHTAIHRALDGDIGQRDERLVPFLRLVIDRPVPHALAAASPLAANGVVIVSEDRVRVLDERVGLLYPRRFETLFSLDSCIVLRQTFVIGKNI